MQLIKNSRWLPVVMAVTIIGITAFHVFSVKESYEREKKNLENRSFWTFRETIRTLQWKQDSAAYALFVSTRNTSEKLPPDSPNISRQRFISMMNVVRDRNNDFAGRGDRGNIQERKGRDNKYPNDRKDHRFDNNGFFEFLRNYKQDSLKLKNISTAFAKRQKWQDMVVPFTIEKRVKKNRDDDERGNNEVVIGFINPVAYKLHLGNITPYLINKISTSIIISLVIVGFTIFSFVLLYKNLLKQQRLADIKNEFISNITHELKTPIATVSVAIEALRNFNASVDPLRSKEFLCWLTKC
jgi:two-component system phosphate regulon sensor histidine kinase PhoR